MRAVLLHCAQFAIKSSALKQTQLITIGVAGMPLNRDDVTVV